MESRPALAALAEWVGVIPFYHDVSGGEHHLGETAIAALLAAMGHDVSTEEAAAATLQRLQAAAAAEIVPPAVVAVVEKGSAPLLRLRVPEAVGLPCRWSVEIELESGAPVTVEGTTEARDLAAVINGAGHGYHRARVRLSGGGVHRVAEADLIVAPPRCWTPADALGERRAFGLWTNLYSVHSGENWGFGDAGDLLRLVSFAGSQQAAFVGINPLHALRNRAGEISPYSPVSRLYRNVLYICVPDVPELAESGAARALVASPEALEELEELRGADIIDYDRVRELKLRVLRVLFRHFVERHRDTDSLRGRAFAEYVRREGEALDGFATFLALDEHLARDGTPVFWREWPEKYRDPASQAVRRFREEHEDDVDWHRWLQFELDRQLGAAADEAHRRGMRVGLYQDLAVGTSEGGSDVWSFQHLFDRGVTVGAPPDDYAPGGQDWGLPPLDPNRLREDKYRYWIALLRSGFRHAGALRIDHAMGVVRLYWIPPGLPATEGGYIRYPAEDLLAILALESHRHEAIVIAEDLGTVPEGFEALLERWGILSSSVLWFEREDGGGFKPQHSFPSRALVTTTTHDHAPLAAWLAARDVEVRREIGTVSEEQASEQIDHRREERAALLARLREAGLLPEGEDDPEYGDLLAATCGFVAGTPARLVGISLDDLAGETTPVNIPGVGPDRYPAWARRMRMSLDELFTASRTARALQTVRDRL